MEVLVKSFNFFITLALIASLSSNALEASKRNKPESGKKEKVKTPKSKKQRAGSGPTTDATLTQSTATASFPEFSSSFSSSSSSSSSRSSLPYGSSSSSPSSSSGSSSRSSFPYGSLSNSSSSNRIPQTQFTQPALKTILSVVLKKLEHAALKVNASLSNSSNTSTLSSSSSNSFDNNSGIDDNIEEREAIILSCELKAAQPIPSPGPSVAELEALTQCVGNMLIGTPSDGY